MKLNPIAKISLLILGLILAFFIFKPFTIIGPSERGIRVVLGKASNTLLKPGLTWKVPLFHSIETFTIKPMEVPVQVEVGPNGAITKDNQTIGANITAFYKYDPDGMYNMYTTYGEEKIKSIFMKSVMESFKADIGQYTIFELPTKQEQISATVKNLIKTKIAEYPIELTELKITNYDWSDEFDNQIQQTMERAQQVKQKEQELLIAQQEAQKKVKVAEANKTATITEAEGKYESAILNAKAKEADGQGIKKYNEALRATLDIEVALRQLKIDQTKAERWNGQYVPINNYGPIPVQTGALQPNK